MARAGWFDADIVRVGILDPEAQRMGLLDEELVEEGVTGFDMALLAAMQWRSPVVFDVPSVVASGMTPPNTFIP